MATSTSKKYKPKPDLKVVIVGEKSVGKTCLLRRYVDRKFVDSSSTIGASFFMKSWGSYNIAIWDTAGEERFSGLSSFYCRGAGAAILAFDPTNEKTFDALSQRFLPLLDAAEEDCLKIVVATKLDVADSENRKVPIEAGSNLALKLNPTLKDVAYFETSSLSGMNVDELFQFIFEHFFDSSINRKNTATLYSEGTLKLSQRDLHNKSSKSNCCS